MPAPSPSSSWYEPAEILGKTPFDLMPPEEAARLRPAVAGLAANPQPFRSLENTNLHRNGSRVVLETRGIPVYDGDGKFRGFRGIDRDITARKEAEARIAALNAELARKAEELENSNRELETFNYTVSHDLRTPLASINLSCQVIQEIHGAGINEQCTQIMKDICATTGKMNNLITALMELSRASRMPINVQTVDLSEMARVVTADLRLNELERAAEIFITDGITASGDPVLLRVLMTNIIGNAWKYSNKKKETVIQFGMEEIGGEPVYFVRDNGTGIDMSQSDMLFTAFQRQSGAREFEGHGIGLATVHRIVQRHGGKIWAEGEVGKGTTFYFTLAPAEAQA